MSGLPSSRHRFALVLALSLLIAAGLITASELSAGKTGTETGRKPAPPATDRLLAGIPQRDAALGLGSDLLITLLAALALVRLGLPPLATATAPVRPGPKKRPQGSRTNRKPRPQQRPQRR